MRGFRAILFFVPHGIPHPAAFAPQAGSIRYHTLSEEGVDRAINCVIRRVPNTWIYYCYNAEHLFYPYYESRSISEFLAFSKQAERAAVVTYIINLYAANLRTHPNAVCTQTVQIDRTRCCAQASVDPSHHNFSKSGSCFFSVCAGSLSNMCPAQIVRSTE